MPIVHVDLMGGRPPDKIAAMIRAISEAVSTSLDAPISAIRVIVNEMEQHQYGVGGKPWPEVLEERRAEGDDA